MNDAEQQIYATSK